MHRNYKRNITVPNKPAQDAAVYNTNKKVIFKRPLFTKCVSKINNTQLGDAQGIDIVIPMYNIIEYSMLIWRHQDVHGNTIGMNHL